MEPNSLLWLGGTVVASVAAAVLAARWMRSDKHAGDLVGLQGEIKAAGREEELKFQAVKHRLEYLEREAQLTRKRYHKIRELVVRLAERVGYKLRRQDLEEDDDDEGD